MAIQIQLRRATAAQWTTANTVLAQGELALETDTLKIKIGDGSTAWTSLAYYQTTSAHTPRVQSQTTTTNQTSLTWSSAAYDQINITCGNTGVTCNIALDSNSSPANGQRVVFRIRDSGTVCNLSWTVMGTNRFRVINTTLPTSTTTASKLTYVNCIYNSTDSTWDVTGVGVEV